MHKAKLFGGFVSCLVAAWAVGSASAAPVGILTLADAAGATSTKVDTSRNFTAKVFFTSDVATTAVDYYLNSITQNGTGTALANKFKIVSRSTATGAYPDASPTDASFTNLFLNAATPTHNSQTVTDVFSPKAGSPATPYTVATFVINADATVPTGNYTLSLTSGAAPDGGFTDSANATRNFTTLGTLTVAVPEPAGLLMLGAGVFGLGLRRHKRA